MLNQEDFEKIVSVAIDAIPEKYFKQLNNVAFVSADDPTEEQRRKLRLRHNQSLFGLYEGIPLTKRASGYNMVLPDKITIFKNPIEQASANIDDVQRIVQNTVWHEVAHYFGLDHDQIHELESR